MQIIKNRKIVEDSWLHVADDEPIADGTDALISWDRWSKEREDLTSYSGRIGVCLPNTIDPEDLRGDLDRFAMVAIDFPIYRDGRAFSIARVLRRLGYGGEIRAVGNVLRDQIYFMERCGFDAYELQDGKSLKSALEGFGEFSVTYQDAIDARSKPRGA